MTDAEQFAYEDRLLSESQAQAYADAKLAEQAQSAPNVWENLGEVSASMDVEAPDFLLFDKDGNGLLPRGDIHTISAKYKNGKSFLCAIMCASVLGCKEFFTPSENVSQVFYFDTEQNTIDSILLKRCVNRLLGLNERTDNGRFRMFNFREMSVDDRRTNIESAIIVHKPDLVIIDGIADINHNFNDITESESTIGLLMKLSKENDCAIVCVLHENKGKDDDNPQGHLGTFLMKKSSDAFKVTKTDETFTFEHRLCRHRYTAPFKFYLEVDEYDRNKVTPHRSSGDVLTDEQAKNERKKMQLVSIMNEAFTHAKKDELSYTDLCQVVMVTQATSIATAKRKVTDAKKMGVLELIPKDKYQRNKILCGIN